METGGGGGGGGGEWNECRNDKVMERSEHGRDSREGSEIKAGSQFN